MFPAKVCCPLFRSALLILSGNMTASLLQLARNLLIARLVSVEDYGIAATFAVVMAVVEMMAAFGLQQQIVQAKEGNDPHFQAVLQGFQVLRGLIQAVVLLVIAGPMARFLGIPEVTWAYRLLAVVPLLNALSHFDVHRLSRQMRFAPMILTSTVPAVVSLAAVWPLTRWLGGWQVMLGVILIHATVMLVLSHLVAERPYRLAFDRAIVAGSLRFGWPLLVNGAMMFLIFNGERLIVGRELGMAELAIFSMGVTLTLTPTLVMAGSLQSFFLPQLSARRGAGEAFQHLADVTMQANLLMALVFVAGTVLAGGPVVLLLLGEKYAALLPLLIGLALVQAVRVLKAGCAVIALSLGQTGNAMVANLIRVLALPLGWYALIRTGDLQILIGIALAAETIGFAVAIGILRIRRSIKLRRLVLPVGVMGLMAAAAASYGWNAAASLSGMPGPGILLLCLAHMALGLYVMRDLRLYVVRRHLAGFEE